MPGHARAVEGGIWKNPKWNAWGKRQTIEHYRQRIV
jgi:hypothetical protein